MMTNRQKAQAKYKASPKGKEAQARTRARYVAKAANRLKIYARNVITDRLWRGLMVRGTCEVCGSKKTHAHHDDYSKPLKVRWLCVLHHTELHEEIEDADWFR